VSGALAEKHLSWRCAAQTLVRPPASVIVEGCGQTVVQVDAQQ
jgi:hypothetical protein